MMIKRSPLLFLLIVILFFFSVNDYNFFVQSQVLPQEEIDSAVWLIQQYRLKLPLTQSGFCNNGTAFICATTPSGYHITSISVVGNAFTGNGEPSATLTSLTFSELTQLHTQASLGVSVPSYNILSYIKNLPKLVSFSSVFDSTITSIPSDFLNGLPRLNTISINRPSPTLSNIDPLFISQNLTTITILDGNIKRMILDQTLSVPTITTLSISMSPDLVQTWTVSQSSFPKLSTLILQSSGSATCNVNVDSTAVTLITLTTTNAGFNLNIANTTSITDLTISGGVVSLEPSDLYQYPNLLYAKFSNSNLASWPFTQWPPKIRSFLAPNSQFTSIPSVMPFPSTLKSLSLSYNQLSGPIPFSLFDPFYGSVDLSHNPGLTGDVPESFCSKMLYAINTSITSLPDCYWCYDSSYSTSLTKPTDFVCNIQIDNFVVPQISRTPGKITGKNLGLGVSNQVHMIIPNFVLQPVRQVNPAPPTNYTIELSTGPNPYTFNFTLVEAGLTFNKIQGIQSINGVQFVLTYSAFNPYIDHTFTLNSTIPCSWKNESLKTYTECVTGILPSGQYELYSANEYYNRTYNVSFTQTYPNITTIKTDLPVVSTGSVFTFNGTFGNATSPSVSLSVGSIVSNCIISYINSTTLKCSVEQDLPTGTLNVAISVDGWTNQFNNTMEINTPQAYCQQTNKCSGHGDCDADGNCICYSGYYGDNCTIAYPSISSVSKDANNQLLLVINGEFGQFGQTNASVLINNTLSCTISSKDQQSIKCEVQFNFDPILFPSGWVDVTVGIENNTVTKQRAIKLLSIQDQCMVDTLSCHGNGGCTINGTCLCNIIQGGAYYDDCSKPYPYASSGTVDAKNITMISFSGDFGPIDLSNTRILINNTINCQVSYSSQQMINCTLDRDPSPYGFASVNITIDQLYFISGNRFIYFPYSNTNQTTTTTSTSGGETPQQQCQRITNDCYGHGYCDENGQCQCDQGYNQDDDCSTKFADNTTVITNSTSPTSSFDIDGVIFSFEVIAIQEIGIDNDLLKELPTNLWNSNSTTEGSLTTITYQLDKSNYTVFTNTNVTATISFSSQARNIQFGSQQLHINPNSIKLAINITNWQYSSNMATLRVVFRTTINNNQMVEYDCDEREIDSLSYDTLGSTIQYLRVVKDDVQFNGRFIDYALSDGRSTYSQTLIINQTAIQESEDSSILLGITLPQCRECLLDPDFTPLLIDKGNTDCDKQSNGWKIAVGVVVGGVGLIAVAAGSYILFKKNAKKKSFNKNIERKLQYMSS